jgi:hypothetical protein
LCRRNGVTKAVVPPARNIACGQLARLSTGARNACRPHQTQRHRGAGRDPRQATTSYLFRVVVGAGLRRHDVETRRSTSNVLAERGRVSGQAQRSSLRLSPRGEAGAQRRRGGRTKPVPGGRLPVGESPALLRENKERRTGPVPAAGARHACRRNNSNVILGFRPRIHGATGSMRNGSSGQARG